MNHLNLKSTPSVKCDNTPCTFREENVTNLKEWINKPCPLCNSNLLTERDYQNYQTLLFAIDLVNDTPEATLNNLSKLVDEDTLKNSPLFKDAEGLELLLGEQNKKLIIEVSTHEHLKIKKIKLDNDNNTKI